VEYGVVITHTANLLNGENMKVVEKLRKLFHGTCTWFLENVTPENPEDDKDRNKTLQEILDHIDRKMQ